MAHYGINIVIPSWNGVDLLRQNLPSIFQAARAYSRETRAVTEIIIVDDGSTDETTSVISREFPQAHLVAKTSNEGFAAACNAGFNRCTLELVALLNNDVRIQDDYLLYQSRHFSNPDVFAVTAKVFEWDSSVFAAGGRFGRFRRGFWSVYFNYDVLESSAHHWIENQQLLSAYAIGGFSTYHRSKLAELGGFHEVLSPFHWEDVDLSYRAWKRGWEIHYEPRSIAFHRASATIDAHFEKRWVEAISFRNRLLFHWINLHSPSFILRHLSTLALLFVVRAFVLDYRFYRSFFQALDRLNTVRELRRKEIARARRSDRDVSRILERFYRLAPLEIYYNQQEVLQKHPEFSRN